MRFAQALIFLSSKPIQIRTKPTIMKPKYSSNRSLFHTAITLAGLALAAPSAHASVIYWDPTPGGIFGAINNTTSWVSPLNIVWTYSSSGVTSRIANYKTTLTDDCTWGGPGTGTTNPLSGGTVPVGTVNAGTLSFRSINGSGAVFLSGGTITLAATTSLTALISTQTHTISSTLAGGATSLTKLGAGTILLSGSNTFTGSTIVSEGTLTLGNSLALQNSVLDATGSITGDSSGGLNTTVTALTLGGLSGNKDLSSLFTTTASGYDSVTSLTFNPATAIINTYSGVIADGAVGMTLTKAGLGTQVLAGGNTFTGGTTVNSGTLTLDYSTQDNSKLSDTSALVLSGGTVDLVGGTHTEVVASTILTGTAKVKRTSGTAKLAMGAISGSGAVDFAADNIATTTNPNNAAGILGGFATVSGTNYAANDGSGNIVAFSAYTDIDARGPSIIPNNPNAIVRILGDGTSGNIELASTTTTIYTLLQSNGNFAPTINTAGKTLVSPGITIATSGESLKIGAAAGDGTLRHSTIGGTLALTNSNAAKVLTVNAGIANNTTASGVNTGGAGTIVLAGPSNFTGALNVTEGTSILSGSVTPASLNVNTNALLTQTSAGSIGGVAAFTHDGSFISTLAGTNSYSGATLINNGVVNIQNGSALGSTASGTMVASGAALQIQGGISVGGEALTLSGSGVSNTGALRNISGDNTFGGLVTLAGTTQIGSDDGTLTLSNPGSITGSTFSLTFAGAGNTTVNSIIDTGSGLLNKEGTGTLILTGANAFTDTVNVSAGVLNIRDSTATGTVEGGVIVNNGAALELQGGIAVGEEALALNGFGISNAGALRNISGDNTWGGALTISTTTSQISSDAGTLTIDVPSGNAIQGTGVAVLSPNMIFSGSGNITVADPIATNAGTLTKDGAGTLTLAGANTYTGNTMVNAGTLALTAGAQLRFVLGATSDSNNSLSGAGAVTLDGDFVIVTTAADALSSGTWTLENVTSLTGPYGPNFSVVGFVDAGSNKWSKANGSKTYTFDETSGILTLAAGGYDAWIDGFFLGETDPLIIGRGADPDFDGFTNLQEFLFGTSPKVGNGSLVTTTTSGGNIVLRWLQRETGSTYTVEQSATLAAGSWSTAAQTPVLDGVQTGAPNDYDYYTVTIPTSGGKLFFRIDSMEN